MFSISKLHTEQVGRTWSGRRAAGMVCLEGRRRRWQDSVHGCGGRRVKGLVGLSVVGRDKDASGEQMGELEFEWEWE